MPIDKLPPARVDGVGIPAMGLAERRAVAEDGDFILVEEVWRYGAVDTPFCLLPRGTMPAKPFVQRNVIMYRSEARQLGLI